MDSTSSSDIILIIIGFVGLSIMIIVKYLIDKKRAMIESKEVGNVITKALTELQKTPQDVLEIMYRNVAELKGYYTTNKQQAKNAYNSALFVCFLGFTIFIIGVAINYLSPAKKTIIPYATLAGAIVEVISGLFFWLYSQTVKQINTFHDKLIETQRYLAAIQIAKSISDENRDKVYANIVDKLMKAKK
ncbi:MAG TPA: hypothetical protein ENI34_06095 [candidate division WOR-3 bacterium]|uniref:Cyanobacterial TRADD-N associated 2 transmembrane domain-containing protein n=1 Tax=candidate division WOR-3 bacterium TaxID=2052148 RepID=A0A9C9EN27_UNCW3|nr:hypothetical protein [candidate division WOR-3 bacterium]